MNDPIQRELLFNTVIYIGVSVRAGLCAVHNAQLT